MSEPAQKGSSPEPRAPWWRRRAFLALAALIALALAVRAALPWAIARTIESQARSQLGLPVRLGNVDLWIVRGAVALEDLVVGRKGEGPAAAAAEPNAATALLRLRRLFVDLDWSDLLERRVHLRELALDAPSIRVERDAEGRIDPLGPPAPADELPPEPSAEEPSEPWTFALDRFDLRELTLELADLATRSTPLEFALGGLSLSDVSVAGTELGLGGIEIQSPVLRVDRAFAFESPPGGSEAASGEQPPDESAEEAEALAYAIERIGIADAAFTLRTDAGPIDLRIRLSAEKVSARSGELFPVDLELGIGGGKLALKGRLGLNPLAYEGRLVYSDLALPPLGVAARPELAEWVRSCRAEGDLAVDLRTVRAGDAEPGLRLAGTLGVRELLLADPSGEEVSLGWKELEVVAREVFVPLAAEGEPARATRVALERVRLVEPDVLYTLPASSLERLLAGGDAEEPPASEGAPPTPAPAAPGEAEATPASPPVELGVDAFELVGGRVRFRDTSVSPPFEAHLRDLAIAVQEAGFPEPHARHVRSTGIIPEAATFSLVGGLEKGSGTFRFELERLALPAFDPYAAGAGYRLARGEASLTSAVRIRGARTEADNQLVLHRLDVASRDAGDFEERFGIPLDLALALLRDPQGDISFGIPVVLDESGTHTGLAAIVAGALRQALVGALSSPLKLVGAVLPGGDGGEASLAPLAAAAGQAALTPDAAPRLESLAELLASRPALGLRLAGRAGPADRPLVAEQILVERAVAGEAWPELEGAGFLERRRVVQALAARGRGESAALSPEDQALLARYAAAVEIPPERMQDLARRRAEAVRDALASSHGIDTARLALAEAVEEGDPAVVIELAVARAASPASVR